MYLDLEGEHFILVATAGVGPGMVEEVAQLVLKRLAGGDHRMHPDQRHEKLVESGRTAQAVSWHRNAGIALPVARWSSTINFPVYRSPHPGIPPTEDLREKHFVGVIQCPLLSLSCLSLCALWQSQ